MVVSLNGGPQNRPQYTIILLIGTPKKGSPNFGKPPFVGVEGLGFLPTGFCRVEDMGLAVKDWSRRRLSKQHQTLDPPRFRQVLKQIGLLLRSLN